MHKQRPNIFFDELDKICVVNPEVTTESQQLNEVCKGFLDNVEEFQALIASFIDKIESLGELVEKEKLKAIGARIKLFSVDRLREQKKNDFTILTNEKRNELDRLTRQLESWKNCEKEQMEIIEKFSNLT